MDGQRRFSEWITMIYMLGFFGEMLFLLEISVIQQKCGCESQHWENTSLWLIFWLWKLQRFSRRRKSFTWRPSRTGRTFNHRLWHRKLHVLLVWDFFKIQQFDLQSSTDSHCTGTAMVLHVLFDLYLYLFLFHEHKEIVSRRSSHVQPISFGEGLAVLAKMNAYPRIYHATYPWLESFWKNFTKLDTSWYLVGIPSGRSSMFYHVRPRKTSIDGFPVTW